MTTEVPVEQMEEEEVTWEVQSVLDKRINAVTGETEYLLKWKKWDGPPTWEPAENCDCKTLINKFERDLRKRLSSSQPPSSVKAPSREKSQSLLRGDLPTTSKVAALETNGIVDDINEFSTTTTTPTPTPTLATTRPNRRKQPSRQSTSRAKTPPPLVEIDSSSCEQSSSDSEEDDYRRIMKDRKLKLKDIVGAVNEKEMYFIVKWHGLKNLEKVPLQVLRRNYSQYVIDFLLKRIRWQQSNS